MKEFFKTYWIIALLFTLVLFAGIICKYCIAPVLSASDENELIINISNLQKIYFNNKNSYFSNPLTINIEKDLIYKIYEYKTTKNELGYWIYIETENYIKNIGYGIHENIHTNYTEKNKQWETSTTTINI